MKKFKNKEEVLNYIYDENEMVFSAYEYNDCMYVIWGYIFCLFDSHKINSEILASITTKDIYNLADKIMF